MKNIIVLLVVIVILVLTLFSFPLISTSKQEIKENFPTQPLQIACTDIDGNFFTTSDLILENLKVNLNTDINNNLKVNNLSTSSTVNFIDNVQSTSNIVDTEQKIEGTQTLTKTGSVVQTVTKQNVDSKNVNGNITCNSLNILPRGSIVMWNSTTAPSGWALCDGNNNTPNLKDRFIVGAGLNYGLNTMGGEKDVTLNLSQMPRHTHSYHYHGGSYSYRGSFEQNNHLALFDSEHTDDIKYVGGNAHHNNMPSYYVLTFIMKL